MSKLCPIVKDLVSWPLRQTLFGLITLIAFSASAGDLCEEILADPCGRQVYSLSDFSGVVHHHDPQLPYKALESHLELLSAQAQKLREQILASDDQQAKESLRDWARPKCQSGTTSSSCQKEMDLILTKFMFLDALDEDPRRTELLPPHLRNGFERVTSAQILDIRRSEFFHPIKMEIVQKIKNSMRSPLQFESASENFDLAQALTAHSVKRLSRDPESQLMMSREIMKTQMAGSDCDDGPSLIEALGPGAELKPDGIHVCHGFLKSTSRFRQIFVFGHELGHAIELGRLNLGKVGKEDLARTVQCLKGQDQEARSLPGDLRQFRAETEVFSDFIGAETLVAWLNLPENRNRRPAEIAKGIKNIFREGMCSSESQSGHPSTRARIQLILSQPQLRSKLGCQPSPKTYCGQMQALKAEPTQRRSSTAQRAVR